METIKKKYIVDENNNKIAVQIDIAAYEKMEGLLENYALVQLMKEDDSGNLEIREAKEFYNKLPKKK
jgi:acyl CoA:acetate/3-ketoacid CoA transferase alpha subunit